MLRESVAVTLRGETLYTEHTKCQEHSSASKTCSLSGINNLSLNIKDHNDPMDSPSQCSSQTTKEVIVQSVWRNLNAQLA